MNYAEVLALLDKGMTPEQILQLNTMPAPAPEPEPVPEPAPEPVPTPEQQEQTPAWAVSLQTSIERMTNAMHANAIMQQQQPGPIIPVSPEEAAQAALASVIAPPKRVK